MPRLVVDLSARSAIIEDEPWLLHFWESDFEGAIKYLKDPRATLKEEVGIQLPDTIRIETVVTNNNIFAAPAPDGGGPPDGGPHPGPICFVGLGGGILDFYRVTMIAHSEAAVGSIQKDLLHSRDVQSA